MRTALIVAITLTFTIGAQAQTRPTGPYRADLYRPPAKGALKHSVRRGNGRYAIPSPASVSMWVMRRGSATDNGRGDEPDAGIGMERAKGIEPSYAAWEAENNARTDPLNTSLTH